MTDMNGGGSSSSEQRLAPVIPLFGGAKGAPANANVAHSGVDDQSPRDQQRGSDLEGSPSDRHPARGGVPAPRTPPRLRALHVEPDESETDDAAPDLERLREVASESLVKKLRARSLSISEARSVLRGHQLAAAQIDDVIDDFCRRGYLDDATLADQLVESGTNHKGQGRVALSRALAQRGIPRDVVDAALGELPDDDAERALEFARSKARSLSRLDADTALRRLMGQLARRGYGGSVAMSAAKSALAEAAGGGRPTGVRFVDSD